ncbi:MAG: Txe/YoeB family addiction module toxin [Dehalococcoidia bacterium]|nr:Txe/YoeB family addiction module toxin [Dehalococcoidia bacterium]
MDKSLSFMPQAWDDYLFWQTQDKKTLKRVNQLLQAIVRNSISGIGKPEPLRNDKAGYWSRRIDEANRIVYKETEVSIVIISCRHHYHD